MKQMDYIIRTFFSFFFSLIGMTKFPVLWVSCEPIMIITKKKSMKIIPKTPVG